MYKSFPVFSYRIGSKYIPAEYAYGYFLIIVLKRFFVKILLPNEQTFNKGITLVLFAWFCGGLLISLPNHGGAGLALPQNILTWMVMGLITLWGSYSALIRRVNCNYLAKLPPGTYVIIAGVVFWTLPIFWSPNFEWFVNAIPKVIALWVVVGFYLYMLAITSCSVFRKTWLSIIVLSAILQVIYSLCQLILIDNFSYGRPVGIFQQVNVLASFLSTGVACAFWLVLNSNKKIHRIISCTGLSVLPAMLVMLQSRAGYIGGILAVIFLIFYCPRGKNSIFMPLTLVTFSIIVGFTLKYSSLYLYPGLFPIINKDGSSAARMYMLKLTWQLIMKHPFWGNGYGSFEAVYGKLAQKYPQGLDCTTVSFPHNELLYAWVEGGVTAFLGLVLIIFGVLKRLFSKGGMGMTGLALLTPIAIHMNLEYPLYQSASHILLLTMLLLVSGFEAPSLNQKENPLRPLPAFWHCSVSVISFTVVIFMLTALITQQRLTRIEQEGLVPFVINEQKTLSSLPNILSEQDRIDFDRHVALLLRYNITKNAALLTEFRIWAEHYLFVYNDPSVYASLLTIARAQHLPQASQICKNAQGRWPADARFNCE